MAIQRPLLLPSPKQSQLQWWLTVSLACYDHLQHPPLVSSFKTGGSPSCCRWATSRPVGYRHCLPNLLWSHSPWWQYWRALLRLPEGPSLTALPPDDLLAQPQHAAQPLVAVEQDSPLQEGPPSTVLPSEGPLCHPPPLTSVVNQQPPTARSSKRSRISSSVVACLLLVEL